MEFSYYDFVPAELTEKLSAAYKFHDEGNEAGGKSGTELCLRLALCKARGKFAAR